MLEMCEVSEALFRQAEMPGHFNKILNEMLTYDLKKKKKEKNFILRKCKVNIMSFFVCVPFKL